MRYLIMARQDFYNGAKSKWELEDGEVIEDRQHAEDQAEALAGLWPNFEFCVVEVPA